MKFIERGTICLLSLLAVVGLHQAVAVFMRAHEWKGLSPSDWAAWVQAVGSIVAIVASVGLVNRQLSAQSLEGREMTRRSRANRLLQAIMIFDQLERFLAMFIDDIQTGQLGKINFEIANGRFTEISRRIDQLSFDDLSIECARSISKISLYVRTLSEITFLVQGVRDDTKDAFEIKLREVRNLIENQIRVVIAEYQDSTGLAPIGDAIADL